MITVRLFALLKERAGTDEIIFRESPSTIGDLLVLLQARIPALADVLSGKNVLFAVNEEVAKENASLHDGDVVALMPPFSGGQDLYGHVRVQREPFSLEAETERIKRSSRSIGGIVTFLGTTRDISRNKAVERLEFEHYPGMAEKKLAGIRDQVIREHGAIDATIIHRVGNISVGDDIVLIVVAAGHRDEAFRACRFCIDELKRITPIWKKETTQDGVVWVEEHP
jgi:MoaD family protein